jgi:hypothetical protein
LTRDPEIQTMTTTSDRLTRLLELQERAHEEREMLIAQRKEIMRRADDAGRDDLNNAEDAEFRALTGRIAKIDAQIESRDEQLKPLAELQALDVPMNEIDDETKTRGAAAGIFTALRDGDKAVSPVEDAPVRRLTLAQAQAITALDS